MSSQGSDNEAKSASAKTVPTAKKPPAKKSSGAKAPNKAPSAKPAAEKVNAMQGEAGLTVPIDNPPPSPASTEEPTPSPEWTVLIVEDKQDYREDAEREIGASDVAYGSTPRIVSVDNFQEAKVHLLAGTIDVLVLDVRDDVNGDDRAGEDVLALLKATRFIPVVLYTAYAVQVDYLKAPPVVQVVGKEEGTDRLVEAVRGAFDSDLPYAVRALSDHVREVTREYLWEHTAEHWAVLDSFDKAEKAQLLVGRLARSLEMTTAQASEEALQGPLGAALQSPSLWHPSRFYVIPPMGNRDDTGDLLLDPESGEYWVQLTPSCDLSQGKADRHLVALGQPLMSVEPFAAWKLAADAWFAIEAQAEPKGGFPSDVNQQRKTLKSNEKTLRASCSELLRGAQDRYFHLPRYLTVPDLLLDMQRVEAPGHATVKTWTRVASLAPPWPQVIVSRFNRQIGRFGFDDPDVEGTMGRLQRG